MRLQLKLLYSPVKWLICLVFVCIIPIAMYVPTYFDFVNLSTLYLPFVSIVLFSDIAILDKVNHTEEIVYLAGRKKVHLFLQRYLLSLGLLIIYLILANEIFQVLHHFRGNVTVEPITLFLYLASASGGSLLIGGVAMTISTLINNVYIGYAIASIYWLYWNVNCTTVTPLNPFPFLANPTSYEIPLIILFLIAVVLVIFTCMFVGKSPFYLADKWRKLIYSVAK